MAGEAPRNVIRKILGEARGPDHALVEVGKRADDVDARRGRRQIDARSVLLAHQAA